jgi:hypothetical protein
MQGGRSVTSTIGGSPGLRFSAITACVFAQGCGTTELQCKIGMALQLGHAAATSLSGLSEVGSRTLASVQPSDAYRAPKEAVSGCD